MSTSCRRIIPVHWRVLECIFLKVGFVFERQRGSHRVYVKKGINRPIIIPERPQIDVSIIHSNLKTAGLTREQYFKLLDECK